MEVEEHVRNSEVLEQRSYGAESHRSCCCLREGLFGK